MKIGIEKLLQWAFVQELCERDIAEAGGPSSSSSNFTMIMEMLELGAIIDRSRNVMAASSAVTLEPHLDALVVADAVRDLADQCFEITDDWSPFADWDDEYGLVSEAVRAEIKAFRLRGNRANGRRAANLVVCSAILGRGPDWFAEKPEERIVERRGQPAWFISKAAKDRFGRSYEFEADGYDRKRKRPMRGAYRKMELSEPIRSAIISRMEWKLWQDALVCLRKSLANQLSYYDVEPFAPDHAPWMRVRKNADKFVNV
ncbi:hypothetical protein [Rhizobium sp. P007]|uniref:hypothetical protein n=1 Tax=Rhizobium phage RR1-A TaxID=929833 RepID=UPI0003425F2D|nr:hypothetical protein [Rhizobium sp. P007]YP_008130213.1 hypothetical protein RHXG_00066 [Rhizobium phage RR1-A]AGN34442.1 hypothetical protein RHXG_00066 [Rhizobium phage RR1-A]CAD7058650.1 hypothetical protein RP007_02655 [Rhizobium sp. P007]